MCWLVWAALLAAACASGGAPRLPHGHLPVPIVRQATSYSCGAAAMQAVFQYWGVYDGSESGLYERLGTTEDDGTDPRAMARVARELGLEAELKEGLSLEDLRAALGEGRTVVLDLQAWEAEDDPTPGDYRDNWEDGHYVVLVGMDRRFVYVMDPSLGTGGYGWMTIEELPSRWRDYEDRDGKLWRNERLGLIVSGERALGAFPAPLGKVE